MNSPRSTFVPCRSRSAHSEMLNDEICIYEWTTKRVHALNATAARVWTLCDRTRSVAQIAKQLRSEFGIHADEVVGLAVAEFSEAGLLEGQVPAGALAFSRRELVKRLGLTAAMLPVVSSIAAPSALEAASGNTQVFTFAGASQTFVVPAGVTQITVDARGGAGGQPSGFGSGLGGRVRATIPVTAGETLIVNVGGTGASGTPGVGGFNGGGQGGAGGTSWGGGGASDVRRASTRLVIAGGGGIGILTLGGAGGGTTGGTGIGGGGGGTQTAGGAGGAPGPGATAGTAGASGIGGDGGSGAGAVPLGGAGGGGGYFGGGGGGGADRQYGPGGGGSSYTDPAATNVTHVQGVQDGNGSVTITW